MELELLVFMVVIIWSYTGVGPRIAHSLNVSVFCSVKCLRYSSKIRTPDRTRIQKFWWRYLPYQRFFSGGVGGNGWSEVYLWLPRGPMPIIIVTLSRKFNKFDIFSRSLISATPLDPLMYLKKLCNKRFLSDIFITF